MKAKSVILNILKGTNIEINGSRPWDVIVHDERFYSRVLAHGSLGLGESYMDGWWDCDAIDELFNRLLRAKLDERVGKDFRTIMQILGERLLNMQSHSRAYKGGEHYNLGNDLFSKMLDPRMVYTCAYWKNVQTLAEAQEAKLDLVCKKIGLQKGMKVLDIGCGWGSFAKFAAEKYGAHVVGINVSPEQIKLGRELCAGLPVELELKDYRDITGSFDRVISIGMFEAVGYKNYRTFMETVSRVLKDDGIFLLHTIGGNTSGYGTDAWLDRYIFPNSMLPSLAQITKAVENLFVVEDLHSFGQYYDLTLMAWFKNFDAHWGELKEKYGDRFYRMWKYYLLLCAGSFRARKNQLWHFVFTKNGLPGGYTPIS